ncbi:MAG TPA: SagB/ThcOx family dehydrogenase [Anaerolinea sp.]|nr:SagB/ThcOx family dehydrogenase [Anaerolinea sp.]
MKAFFADFLNKTAYPQLSPTPQGQGVPQPPLELAVPEGSPIIPLPAPDGLRIPPADLRAVIEQRRSLRRYAETPLSLEELSYLLWLTQGVKRVSPRPATLRTVPSAGARHAFETFLLVNRVDGLRPGLYRFIATRHALLALPAAEDITEQIMEATHGQESVGQSAVTFLWAAVTERMSWRYVERSMRYLFLDAGHVCQNLYLAAESIGCGVCAIAAYEDADMNALLGLDGVDQFVIYIGTVGKKPG